MTTLKLSIYAGILLALPVLLYQVYAFLLPALKPTEKRVVLPFLLLVPVLFIAGVVFAYFVVVPAAIKFLLNFNQSEFNIQVRASEYYSFFILTLLALGLVFQVPMGILAVTRLGITTPEQLAHNRRYAYLILAVVAMLLPGTDPVTMLIEMAPLLALFEFSLILARLWAHRPSALRSAAGARAARQAPPARLPNVLFDLRGKRKRVVQVSYSLLAAIFLIGFVGFRSEAATRRRHLRRDRARRQRQQRLVDLAVRRSDRQRQPAAARRPEGHRCAREAVAERVPEGQGGREPGPDHRSDERQLGRPHGARRVGRRLDQVPDASTRESPTSAPPPRSSNAFIFLGDATGAAQTQKIVAADQPSQNSYGNLAIFEYSAGDIPAGDAAAKKAVEPGTEVASQAGLPAARPDPQAGCEGEEAAGEGEQEGSRVRHPADEPAPEPAGTAAVGARAREPSLPSRPPGR